MAWALAGLPRGAPVWAASPSAFGNRWRLYVEDVLQLSADSVQGFCPAGLRAGCATELYEETHDLVLVQWQLRHGDLATLQCYVQERLRHPSPRSRSIWSPGCRMPRTSSCVESTTAWRGRRSATFRRLRSDDAQASDAARPFGRLPRLRSPRKVVQPRGTTRLCSQTRSGATEGAIPTSVKRKGESGRKDHSARTLFVF